MNHLIKIIFSCLFLSSYLLATSTNDILIPENPHKTSNDLQRSTFLNTSPIETDTYSTESVGQLIDHYIPLVKHSNPVHQLKKHEYCDKIFHLFLESIFHKDGKNILKILLNYASNHQIPSQFHARYSPTPINLWTIPSVCLTQLTFRALSAQDICGYSTCIQLLPNLHERRHTHLLTFEKFLKMDVLSRTFIRQFGKFIDFSISHQLIHRAHLFKLLHILNKYDLEPLSSEKEHHLTDIEEIINFTINPYARKFLFLQVRKKLQRLLNDASKITVQSNF